MPSATVPGFSTLYDSRGNPIPTGPQGTQYRRTREDDDLRPPPPNHYGDYTDLLSPANHRRLVSESRALGGRGQPFSLLDQKADYVSASDFRPQFRGQDPDYGTAALPLLEDYLKIANLRGYLFDWKTTWRLTVPTMATDGRVYVLLTRWPDSDWPAIQIIETHRIGQRDPGLQLVGKSDATTTITDAAGKTKTVFGAYRGLRINKGIITNAAGTEVAYRVLGGTPDEDQDISARDLYPLCRPRAFSEGATPPELAAALFDFIGLELAQSAQLDQQIEDARLTLIETNASGKYDPGAGFGGGNTGRGPAASPDGAPTVESKRGRTRFIKTGFTVTPHQSERPSDQWMNFDSRLHSRGAAGIRWRSEMLDPAALKAAANRALQDQINTLIRETFTTVEKGAARALNYIAACLTAPPVSMLPLHAESQKWGIAHPPWFEVDRASAKYDLDDAAAGRVSMRTLRGRDGKTSMEVYQERAQDYLEAQKVSAATGVPIEIIRGDEGVTVQRTGAQTATDPTTE